MGKIHDALERSGTGSRPETFKKTRSKRIPERKVSSNISLEKTVAFKDSRIKHPEIVSKDVSKPLPVREVSQPFCDGKEMDPNLIVYHRPQSMEAEFFKILKTNILFPSKGNPPRSILVTSAVPGEGKSFVTANLAISIANGIEDHVLLMDCDMRRPTIHSKFGIPGIVGLNEYLTKGVPLSELLVNTVIDKLTILPVGGLPTNPTELLSSAHMKKLLDEVKQRYRDRFILVDSPPPQLTAETAALAKRVDGVLLVIKAGKTPRKLINEIIEQIGREKIIGVVLNWYDIPFTKYYGYGKYNKYYNNE
jgi:exopolysaccharide/PEP-CTERM locus tyrosine autokinase